MPDTAETGTDREETKDAVPGSSDSNGKSFSQADVDRIVQERLARDRQNRPTDDEVKELREKASKLDELEQANQSELEKLQKRAEKAEKERQDAIDQANRRLAEVAIREAAAELGAVKPELMPRLIDTEQVTVADDGQVTGARDAVKAFLEQNPELVGSRPGGSADQGAREGGREGQLSRADLSKMSAEEIVKAKKDGLLDTVLGR